MTPKQVQEAKRYIGKMSARDIAAKLGVSISNLKRAFRGTRLVFHNRYVANPALVQQVGRYYEKHGLKKTEEYFENSNVKIRVRSIVERYKCFRPRQIRWTGSQIVEAVRMSGFVNLQDQAKFFNRPRANAGSIKSLMQKKFGYSLQSIHGMRSWNAKEVLRPKCPTIETCLVGPQRDRINIVLWVDAEKNILKDTPRPIKDAIRQLATFQRWLYGSKNPRKVIEKIKLERGSKK